MEVICERCRTEYEFEDTLISPRGTRVRCTNCGFVFRVFAPLPAATEPLNKDAYNPALPPWRTRKAGSAEERPVYSLRELQQQVTNGLLLADDEICRRGGQWKKVRSIPEFASALASAVFIQQTGRPASSGENRPSSGENRPSSGENRPSSGETTPSYGTPLPPSAATLASVSSSKTGSPSTPSRVTSSPTAPASQTPQTTSGPNAPGAPQEVTRIARAPRDPSDSATPVVTPQTIKKSSRTPTASFEPRPGSYIPRVAPSKPAPSPPSQSSQPSVASKGDRSHDSARDAIPPPSDPDAFQSLLQSDPAMASLAASRSSLRGIQNIKDVPNIKGTLSNETVRVRLPAEFGGPDASYANATESPSTEHPAGVYTPMPGPRGKWALLGVILAVAAGVIVVIQWPVLSGWFVANDRARSARTPDARNDSPQPPLAAPPAASPTPSSASETPVQAASPGADTKAAAAPEGSTAPNTDAQTGATSAPSTDAVGQGLTQTQQRPNPAAASTAKTDKPEEYPVLLRRAKRAALQKNFKVAEQLYKDALAARPGALEAQSGLGYLALEQGNYASAISYFDTISASGFGEGFIGLGRTYRRMNRRSDALEAFEQYLSRFPSGDLATVARKHVEELSPKAAESASDPTKPGASAPATTPADSSSATPPPLDKTADAGVTP